MIRSPLRAPALPSCILAPALALAPVFALVAAASAAAQVPDGWIVWGSFQGSTGQNGIYFSHPRDPNAPFVPVTGLAPALAFDPAGRRGAACVTYSSRDELLIAGERAPAGTSVDLHVMRLNGAAVVLDRLFSVGTSANVGEIPQCSVLSDGRIVVGATDLAAGGPLAQFQTLQYNWQGLGIVDPESGGVTPIPVSNLNQFPGVVNGLAVSLDEQTVYVGNYVSATSGDLWAVPIGGGTATQVATLPAGASNVAVDNDGTVLVATLNGPPNLFRYDPVGHTTTPLATTSGPLNAVVVERVTGNYIVATANAGAPARSLYWIEPNGTEHLLLSPNSATIAAVGINPNPEAFGAGTPGSTGYRWQLAPNPGGMPFVGNANFGLTLASDQAVPTLVLPMLGVQRLATPVAVLGIDLLVDPATAVTSITAMPLATLSLPLPIPNDPMLVGFALFAQTLHLELTTNQLAASPGVHFTVL